MNATELTVEIAKLRAQVEKNEALVDDRFRYANTDLGEIKVRLGAIEKLLHELDKRLAISEKGSDTLWRFAPLVLSGIAIVVSLFVANFKK